MRGERASGVGAGAVTTDLSYFRRRASEERTAALNSRDPRVRRVHVEMAERYEGRVREMRADTCTMLYPCEGRGPDADWSFSGSPVMLRP